jgi:hypothetical protein
MNTYYQIECWNSLFKKWIRHDFKDHNSLKNADQEVERFKQNKLGTKFRILEIKIIKK